jgi:hypothetical protein
VGVVSLAVGLLVVLLWTSEMPRVIQRVHLGRQPGRGARCAFGISLGHVWSSNWLHPIIFPVQFGSSIPPFLGRVCGETGVASDGGLSCALQVARSPQPHPLSTSSQHLDIAKCLLGVQVTSAENHC